MALDELIRRDPRSMLGPQVVERFGPTLPFLFKLLAAEKPLSLQAHPSLEQARAGFARENALGIALTASNRSYKDANHKPELICALTPFRALCGFREFAATVALLRSLHVEGLEPLLGADSVKTAFQWLMQSPKPELVNAVVAACAGRTEPEFINATALGAAYPGDVGVIGALLLNLVTLQPGEALALGAGNMHAYLEGLGVELMANSDNVLRGGLTPKHVDVPELLSVLNFTTGPVEVLRPVGAPEAVYQTPFADFRLSRLDISAPLLRARTGPDIVWCLDGSVVVNGLELKRGEAGFVSFDEGSLQLTGRGTLFRATVNT